MLFIYHPYKIIGEVLQLVIDNDEARLYTDKDAFLHSCLKKPEYILFFESTPAETVDLLAETLQVYHNESPPKITLLCFSSHDLFVNLTAPLFPEVKAFIRTGIISLQSLPCKINDLRNSITKDEIIRSKNMQNLKKRLEEQWDITTRHKMGNARAADRLLNGAIRSDDFDFSKDIIKNLALSCYTKLLLCTLGLSPEQIKSTNDAEPKKGEEEFIRERKRLVKQTTEYKKLQRIIAGRRDPEASGKGLENNPWDGKILVIDDQIEIWKPVWNFIFRQQVDIVSTGQDGLDRIASNDYHCVLLDIDLGEGQDNGLSVLQRIRNIRFEVPVIIMSNFDHALLTKLCLSSGADNYFIKELQDSRDSIEYYGSLIDMIKAVPAINDERRTMWKEFVRLEPIIEAIDENYMTQIGALTRKAFYYLTLDADHFLPAKLLIPVWFTEDRNRFESVALNAQWAADDIFKVSICLTGHAIRSETDPAERISKAGKLLISGNHPNFKERLNISRLLDDPESVQFRGLHRTQHARHAGGVITEETALGCVSDVISLFQKLLKKENDLRNNEKAIRHLFSHVGIQKSKDIDLKIFGTVQKDQSSHAETSTTGAKQFAEGLKKVKIDRQNGQTTETRKNILFIDDEGEDSPWVTQLKIYFNKKGFSLTTIADYSESIDLSQYILVLLDLSFPGQPEGGLNHLRAIKERDVSIPVIMLTADTSGLSSRKCLYKGADDYFIKSPSMNPENHVKSFDKTVTYYLEQVEDSHRRSWWHAILAFNNRIGSGAITLNQNEIELFRQGLDVYRRNFYQGNELLAIVHYLKESYFYYLLHITESHIEEYRARRLLNSSNFPLHESIFSLAKFVELITGFQTVIVRGKDKEPNNIIRYISEKIPRMHQTDEVVKCFNNIWNDRNKIKNDSTITYYQSNFENIIKDLEELLKSFQFNRIKEGDRLKGKIKEYARTPNTNRVYGVFVEMFSGKDGLLHLNEIKKHPDFCNGYLNIEDKFLLDSELEVSVTGITNNKGRIQYSLGLAR